MVATGSTTGDRATTGARAITVITPTGGGYGRPG